MTEVNKNKHEGSSSSSSSPGPPSNERLLCTAFVSFCSFALVQSVVAVIAGSEAMLADTAAMVVDAITYLFNWYAERQKQYYGSKLNDAVDCKSSLLYRKYTLQLEIVPPLFSVSILLIVTLLVFNQAMEVLILDIGKSGRDQSLQADPNVHLMMLFSVLNLFLDFMNVFCFARAKHAMGYNTISNTVDDDYSLDRQKVNTTRSLLSDNSYDDIVDDVDDDDDNNNEDDVGDSSGDPDNKYKNDIDEESAKSKTSTTKKKSQMAHFEIDQNDASKDNTGDDEHHYHSDSNDGSNLNMCSAYTHVFADTLRSIAVIFASTLAEFHPKITSEVADAGAAVVVSILIALSLIPLITGMVQTIQSLRRVNILIEEQNLMEAVKGGDDDDYEEGDWT